MQKLHRVLEEAGPKTFLGRQKRAVELARESFTAAGKLTDEASIDI